MASEGECVEISSFVRGYHAYIDIRVPAIDEVLRLGNKPTNAQDRRAVAVKKNGQIFGQVPKGFLSAVFYFLNRPCIKGVVKITGAKVIIVEEDMAWNSCACIVFWVLNTTCDD